MEILDYSYTVAFIIEMILKLIGLGPRLYVADTFNILDASIVLLSIFDFILFHTVIGQDENNQLISSVRAFRLLRVFRLARIWFQFK